MICLLAFNCLVFHVIDVIFPSHSFLDIPFFRRRMPSPILLKMFNPSERFGSNQLRGCALCKMINSFPSFYHIIPSFFDIIFAEFVNSRNHHKLLRNYWRGIIFTSIIKLFKDLKKKDYYVKFGKNIISGLIYI